MNPILLITFNNVELTKKAVESALEQDVEGGVELVIINNGSTDSTRQWLSDLATFCKNVTPVHLERNEPVAKVSNAFLAQLFKASPHVLGMPNDVVLHRSLYREFLQWPRGLVTGSEIKDKAVYDDYIQKQMPPLAAVSENTPMAVILVRRWVYEALIAKDGMFFDERFIHYASDCDLALRVASCGIHGVQLNTPYWHYGSASVRLADPFHLERIRMTADEDRARFVAKWGFRVDSLEYGQSPQDLNFRGER